MHKKFLINWVVLICLIHSLSACVTQTIYTTNGFAIKPPQGSTWVNQNIKGTLLSIKKLPKDGTHIFFTGAAEIFMATEFKSPQQFLEFIKKQEESNLPPEAYRVVETEYKLQPSIAPFCVYYYQKCEDRVAKNRGTDKFLIVTTGYTALHPEAPKLGIDIWYTERYANGEASHELQNEGNEYLATLKVVTKKEMQELTKKPTRTSGISYLPDIRNKFGEESERILVLPIWQTYPLLSAEGQETVTVFGEPIFSMVKELPNLYKTIPSKTSVSLMGIDAIIIISETGTMISIQCPIETRGKVRCEQFYNDYMFPQWRDDLVEEISRSNGGVACLDWTIGSREMDCQNQAIWELMDTADVTTFKSKRYQLSFSDKEKQSVIFFLSNMSQLVDPFEGYGDRNRDKKTGEPCRDLNDCAPGYFCRHHKCKNSGF